MAVFYPVGGGAPGIDPNSLTTDPSDILYPKIGGVQGNYNGVQGTLQLTGNTQPNHVLENETFYTTNAKSKQTGTMKVQSILSFSSAPYSASQIVFSWQNPQNGPFSGVIIVGKTGGYPVNINDGTRYYKGFGSNGASLGISNVILNGFSLGVTYYFRAFGYCTINNEEWISSSSWISNTIIQQITQTITSSGTWTVPLGVNRIDIFLVGGGGSGGKGGINLGGGGGGGGNTVTTLNYIVSPSQTIPIIIGSGGNKVTTIGAGINGGDSIFNNVIIAHGGKAGSDVGGSGGSGGGGGANWYYDSGNLNNTEGGDGGSNGSNGGGGYFTNGGIGQNSTTKAFGESSETAFSAGGGGGSRGRLSGTSYVPPGLGGVYGGGNGGSNTYQSSPLNNGQDATPNSGSGGGGNGSYGDDDGRSVGFSSGSGGSGICIIRYVV